MVALFVLLHSVPKKKNLLGDETQFIRLDEPVFTIVAWGEMRVECNADAEELRGASDGKQVWNLGSATVFSIEI